MPHLETDRLVLRIPTLDDLDRWAEMMADADAARFIGGVSPKSVVWRVIGWGLHPDAWGKGYAVEAATAAMDYAFDVLEWTNVVHCINPENARSAGVARRLGSTIQGSARMPPPYDNDVVDLWGQSRGEWARNRDRT